MRAQFQVWLWLDVNLAENYTFTMIHSIFLQFSLSDKVLNVTAVIVYIWQTCPRNYIPLEISWCFPKWVFSLVFLWVLIFDLIYMGIVSFIKSRVSTGILHKKYYDIFLNFIDQHPQMLRKNAFYASNWIFFLSDFFYSLRREKGIFSKHLWMLVNKIWKNVVYIVVLHVKLEPRRIQIVEMRAKFVWQVKFHRFTPIFLPPWFLTKKHVNSSNIWDTPIQFFCAGSRERLVIWWKKQTLS
jgi:hypothetical protein